MKWRTVWRGGFFSVIVLLTLSAWQLHEGLGALAAAPAPPVPQAAPASLPPPATPASRPQSLDLLPDLPPVSLNVSHVPLPKLIESLNAALGGDLVGATSSAGVVTTSTFTIDARAVPFWELFRRLSEPTPLSLGAGRGLQIVAVTPEYAIRRFQNQGPVLLCLRRVSYKATGGGPVGPPVPPPRIMASLLAAVDPRISIVRQGAIAVTRGLENRGHVVVNPSAIEGSNVWTYNFNWDAANDGAREVSLGCEVRFRVQLSQALVTVNDAASHVGEAFTLAGHKWTLNIFQFNKNQLTCVFAPADDETRNIPMTYRLFDAAGKEIFDSLQHPGNSVITFGPPAPDGPFRLELRAPDRTADVVVPFDLTVPLP
jgi:hypothetical protein